MSARAASQDVKTRSLDAQSYVTENGDTLYAGSMVALKAGYLRPFQGTAGEQPVGRMVRDGSVVGDGALLATASLADEIIEAVPVSGASTIADVGKVVYLNSTDDLKADLTLTRPTRAIAFGVIEKFRSATSFDVLRFGRVSTLATRGVGQIEVMHLGSYGFAGTADGNIRVAHPCFFRGKILSVHAYTDMTLVGAGGTTLINLEIDTVDVTGGVVTMATATQATIGTKSAGTAVTDNNTFSEGSVIDVECASTGGTRTSGNFSLYAVVERLPGI